MSHREHSGLGVNTDLAADQRFCRAMLPRVSRTFAVSIRLLPPRLEWPVLLAYLLCRVADTIEDQADLPVADKRRLLSCWSAAIASADSVDTAPVLAAFAAHRAAIGPVAGDADRHLAANADRVRSAFLSLDHRDREAIRPWVQDMCAGMADFAETHARAAPDRLEALASEHDLERYCYYVAGTVGHLLTDLFRVHIRGLDARRQRRLSELATAFGLGLQLTNIIKDVADDRQRGWSYVPREWCEAEGTRPEDLLSSACPSSACHSSAGQAQRRVMNRLIAKAAGELDAALEYCRQLPHHAYRVRLFCLTPLYFAVATLRRAARDPRLLDPQHKVKINRRQVRAIVRTSALVAPLNGWVSAYYRRLQGERSSAM